MNTQIRGYCGLENQGSCCLNAVLQTLFMTKEFREHVESVSSDDDFIKELKKLFNELETQKKAVSAAEIMKSLGITDVHNEQDAAELLHLILKKTESSEIFKGTIKTTITWRSCGHKQESLEDFFSLIISFKDSQDVEDAVEAHIDQMCGEYPLNCFHCNSTGCKKESEMINFPKLLIIQLTRFEKVSYGYRKNVWKVIIHPQIKVSSQTYELYAIVNHCGTYDGGYYNADIKCEDKIWYRFNDCSVSESPLKSVFINESSTLRSSFAYLLVYRRRE